MVLSISFSLFQRVTHHIIQFFKLTQWFKLASLQQSTNIENQDKATTISIWNTLKSKNKFNIHIHTNNSVHTLLTVVTPSCANCIWQGGTCPPLLQMAVQRGTTSKWTAIKKLTKLYCPSRKRSPKTTNCTRRAKKVEGDKKIRCFAPTMCFPPPLLKSFWHHWSHQITNITATA